MHVLEEFVSIENFQNYIYLLFESPSEKEKLDNDKEKQLFAVSMAIMTQIHLYILKKHSNNELEMFINDFFFNTSNF